MLKLAEMLQKLGISGKTEDRTKLLVPKFFLPTSHQFFWVPKILALLRVVILDAPLSTRRETMCQDYSSFLRGSLNS
jgi:hypothetical protein